MHTTMWSITGTNFLNICLAVTLKCYRGTPSYQSHPTIHPTCALLCMEGIYKTAGCTKVASSSTPVLMLNPDLAYPTNYRGRAEDLPHQYHTMVGVSHPHWTYSWLACFQQFRQPGSLHQHTVQQHVMELSAIIGCMDENNKCNGAVPCCPSAQQDG